MYDCLWLSTAVSLTLTPCEALTHHYIDLRSKFLAQYRKPVGLMRLQCYLSRSVSANLKALSEYKSKYSLTTVVDSN